MEQLSQGVGEDRKETHCEQATTIKRVQHLPFNQSTVISFVKFGICHMCKAKGRIVYQCFRAYQATSCEKKFCFDCLTLIYKENISETLQKSNCWRCPYSKKICRCKNCCLARKEPHSILQLDPSNSVYSNLRTRLKKSDEEQEGEQQSMRCLLKQKFKRLIDFNGQLINKVNSNYHKLTDDQISLYNKLMHSNLSFMNNLSKKMALHQTLTIED